MEYVNSYNVLGMDVRQKPSITGTGAPTTATEGAVGELYQDTNTGDLYKCTSVADGVYTWDALASKQYVDEISEECVQKYKKTSGRYVIQHIVPNADGGTYGVTELSYSGAIPSGYAIPIGDGAGRVTVGAPTEGKHATTKEYVDGLIAVKERTQDGARQIYTDNATDNNNRTSLIVDEHGNVILEPLNEREGVATDAQGNPIKSELSGVNNFVKGRGNKVSSQAENEGGSVVMGDKNTVTKAMSITLGYENTNNGAGAAFVSGNNNTVNGFAAHAEGKGNFANGSYSHVEGNGNTAEGSYSHVEGYGNTAGDYGHAEGRQNTAGNFGHVEGYNCQTTMLDPDDPAAETWITGAWAHAEGRGTTSIGTGSHSEGNGTLASGNDAHAEGYNTKATAAHSHAEGSGTEASGVASHAGGTWSMANHENSFAHGHGTQTGRNNQFVVGEYNTGHQNNLFEVGAGANSAERKNAFWVGPEHSGVQSEYFHVYSKIQEYGYHGRNLARYRYSETSAGASDKIPASCKAPGVPGEFVVGVAAGYLYICVGENSWVRVPLAASQNW